MKVYNLAVLLLLAFSFSSGPARHFAKPVPVPESQPIQKTSETVATNIIFNSTDGGQTWQDISAGLPADGDGVDFRRDCFLANDNGLYLRAGNAIYRSKSTATAPYWDKVIFEDQESSIGPGKSGISASEGEGKFLEKGNETKIWPAVYTKFPVKNVRAVFESKGGTIFITSDHGLFKSANSGKTWEKVNTGGWVMKIVESNGILMATSQGGILRSTDDGKSWDHVLYEGGVGIDIEPIKGGFAAINFNTESQTRRIRTSYDGGKTWLPIDAGLRGDLSTTSIIQVEDFFLCGHPDGIYKSTDKGKTWKLLLPSIGNKVFNLFVSGNVIYAIPIAGGC